MVWDIKPPKQHNWTAVDWDIHRFFKRVIGSKVKATIYNGYAYVAIYNPDKPSKSILIKSKM